MALLAALIWISALPAVYQVAAVTDNFVLHTSDGVPIGSAEFLEVLNQRMDALQMSTGVYLDSKADIYVVPDRSSYQSLARGKGAIVEFSNAFYSPAEKRIYIRSADQIWENYGGIIIHEYTHWYLDEILLSAPLWFHEGLATREGGQLGMDRYLYYVRERFWGNKMDLFELAYRYPSQRAEWEMYYLSSYFAVKHMRDKDPEAWRGFWTIVADNYRQGQKTRFTAAFGQAYGSSLYQFNLEFAAASKRQAWIYLIVGVNSIIFTLLPLLLILAALRRRKRMKALPELEIEPDPEPERKLNYIVEGSETGNSSEDKKDP
ncbi:MAG: hypothetical protein K0B87_00270 [Candidatus Syntrophosphaera sp.]|nr:hypothetical protein [Candidatus Syntrophosphaera sp.]